MKIRHGQVRVGWPTLPQVVEELASMLVSDDWTRYSTEDDETFYYILGNKAWTADQEGEQDFCTLSAPIPQDVSPVREAEVHAQVAAIRPARHYVDRASERLEATGVDGAVIATFVNGCRGKAVDWAMCVGKFAFPPGSQSLSAFCDLLRALSMEAGVEPEPRTEAEKRQELEVAVQKVYLQELAKLYESILRRAGPLVTLTFSDPQLNEASRCYLYGFFRGAIILSASALESNLRMAVGPSGVARVDQIARTGGYFAPTWLMKRSLRMYWDREPVRVRRLHS